MAPLIVFIHYEAFGSTAPESGGNPLFGVQVRTYPGALNTLDDSAKKVIAELEGVQPGNLRLLAPGKGYASVIEGLLRNHRPRFESEVETTPGGAGIAWFSYSIPPPPWNPATSDRGA